MYDATEKRLTQVNSSQLPEQVVLQRAKPDQVAVSIMSHESFHDLVDVLNARNMGDKLARATMFLDKRVGKKFLGEALSFDDADNMPLRKAINLAYEFYVANGLNQATVEDLLAKGLFSMSLYMGELAKSCVFKKVK
ncbi:hypothetical protein LRY65_05320 [Candidatus Woesebacteria bacterium]|nr:hypothetical protein [Candidatus Woesebacteria bacterium]MCD8546439.1 hypothetical protein [Candidatus Woesebacteria bacterium]